MAACAGCLDSRWCWVCEGYGRLPLRDGSYRGPRCQRCLGSGICAVCSYAAMDAWLRVHAGSARPRSVARRSRDRDELPVPLHPPVDLTEPAPLRV